MLKAVTIEPILKVTDLYTLYYFQHKSGYRFEGESHDFWEIIYVDHGSKKRTDDFSSPQCFSQF